MADRSILTPVLWILATVWMVVVSGVGAFHVGFFCVHDWLGFGGFFEPIVIAGLVAGATSWIVGYTVFCLVHARSALRAGGD